MRILLIVDPLSTFKTYKDSIFAMMYEAAACGYIIYTYLQLQFTLANNVVEIVAAPIALTGDEDDWYRVDDARLFPFTGFGAMPVCKSPPFDMEYVISMWLLKIAERRGICVFNKPQAIRDHSEKLTIAQPRELTVPTIVSRDTKYLREFYVEQGDVTFKPLNGVGGVGVFHVELDGLNLEAMIKSLTDNDARTIMTQQYVPAIREGDKRIFLIGGLPVPYLLAQMSMVGEVRGNLAAGGMGRTQPPSGRGQVVAHVLALALWQRGLSLIDLDIVGDHLTEVNATSPACFQEIMQQTGFNAVGAFIDALERTVGKSSGSGRKPA